MSQAVLDRLSAQLGDRILETSDAFGEHEAIVAVGDWVEVAQFLKDDEELQMDHFITSRRSTTPSARRRGST